MKAYRKKLKIIIAAESLLMILSIILVAFSWQRYQGMSATEHQGGFFQGFQSGLFAGWALMMLWGVIRSIRALLDEKYCRKRYIKEHDERSWRILTEARSYAFAISIFGIMAATVVSGYYDFTIFFTLLGVTFFMGLVAILTKFFFHKTL